VLHSDPSEKGVGEEGIWLLKTRSKTRGKETATAGPELNCAIILSKERRKGRRPRGISQKEGGQPD